jgi:hypothetical protein
MSTTSSRSPSAGTRTANRVSDFEAGDQVLAQPEDEPGIGQIIQ